MHDGLDGFVGREAELREIRQRLDAGARIVTLVGPGGVGKTRLAARIFGERDAAAWVAFEELGELDGCDDIVPAIGRALGIAHASVEDVVRAITDRPVGLLVLDDAERYLHATAEIARRLTTDTAWSLLCTSRRPLAARGEHLVWIEPLATAEAITLLDTRVSEAGGVLQARLEVLERLVERLDCLPLAIELAAARLGLVSPAGLLDRLDGRFAVLDVHGGDDDRPSLSACIDLSWRALGTAEQAALIRLTAFRSPFTLDAAEAVIERANDGRTVIGIVDGLRRRSLLQSVVRQGQRRLRMLQTVRDFVRARCSPADACAAADAHLRWVLGDEQDGTATAEAESAFEYALATDRPVEAVRLFVRLEALWYHGRATEGLVATIEKAIEDCAVRDGQTANEGRLVLAQAIRSLGRWREAAAIQRASLVSSGPDFARTRLELARTLVTEGGYAEARTHLEAVLDWADAHDDPLSRAHANASLAIVADGTGDRIDAEHRYALALAAFADAGDEKRVGVCTNNHAAFLLGMGRAAEALAGFRRASTIFERLGAVRLTAYAVLNQARSHRALGDAESAARHLDRADALASDTGDERLQGGIEQSRGLYHLAFGRPVEAELWLDRSRRRLARVGGATSSEPVEVLLAISELRRGVRATAERLVRTAEDPWAAAILRSHLELAEARSTLERGDNVGATARLDTIVRAAACARERTGDWVEVAALDLLDQDITRLSDDLAADRADPAPLPSPAPDRLVIDAAFRGYWTPDGTYYDLRRRRALRRILGALVRSRLQPDPRLLSLDRIIEAGWPGHEGQPRSMANRAHVALSTLRRFGLDGLLVRKEAGYGLDLETPIAMNPSDGREQG